MKLEKTLKHANKLWFPLRLIFVFTVFQIILIAAFFISIFKWQLPNVIKLTTEEK
jgi:hypothetical protein